MENAKQRLFLAKRFRAKESKARFRYEEVQALLKRAGLKGEWRSRRHKRDFRTKTNVVVRFLPSTGQVELLGDPIGRTQVWYRLDGVLMAQAAELELPASHKKPQ